MADGWTELGAGLAGGWGDGREAFVKQMKLHGDAGEALAQARIARSRAMAHEGLPAAVAGVYQDPAQAALNAAILGASATPNLRNTGDLQRPGYLALEAERQDAMRSGDFKRMNAITSVLGDKQHEPVRVTGGVMLPSGVPLGDPEFGVTPLPQTEAQIRQRDAAAGVSNARAGAYGAQAAAGGWKPSAASGGGKPPKFTAPSNATLKATLGDDPARMSEFRGWQAQQAAVDPAYNNGDFALAQFTQGNEARRGINFGLGGDVALPASVDPDAIRIVMEENRVRGARGLPPLTREEQIAMVQQHMDGGVVRAPVLGSDGVPSPRPPGGVAAVPAGPGTPQPKSKAEYDALPPGTRFIAPDGTMRIKP
jgi:hypothetical protein